MNRTIRATMMYRVLTDRICECSVCGEVGSAPNELWWYVGDETVCEDCADSVDDAEDE